MINLLRFNEIEFKPSKRKTKCKNCDSMFGLKAVNFENGNIIKAGEPRYVLKDTFSFGSNTRHLTLCKDCLIIQLNYTRAFLKEFRGLK